MKKIETLKKNYQFRNVLTKGQVFSGKQIIVYIRNNKVEKNRLGIAIHTKLAKAVKRNRLKRLIRENYRLISQRLLPGKDIVFLWNKKVDYQEADFFQIQKYMEKVFQKGGILSGEENMHKDTTIL